MTNKINLYNQSDFQEFTFIHDIKNVFDKFSIEGVVRGQYFIVGNIKSCNFKLMNNFGNIESVYIDCNNIIQDNNLIRHGLYTGKVNFFTQKTIDDNNYIDLCYSVISAELSWVEKFFKWINSYLSKRISDSKYLTHHDSIKVALAEVIENVHMAKSSSYIFLNGYKKIDILRSMARSIETGVKKLADCAGGRGFTRGNILELYWLSLLLNQFLLGEVL